MILEVVPLVPGHALTLYDDSALDERLIPALARLLQHFESKPGLTEAQELFCWAYYDYYGISE